jgi:hypothetical protein
MVCLASQAPLVFKAPKDLPAQTDFKALLVHKVPQVFKALLVFKVPQVLEALRVRKAPLEFKVPLAQ